MTAEKEKQILKAIDDRELAQGGLPPALVFYRQLLRLQYEASSRIETPILSFGKQNVKDKLRKGQPLLDFCDIPIEWTLFHDLFERTCSILSSQSGFEGEIPQSLKEPEALRALAESWYQGEPSNPDENGPGVVTLALQASLKPFLSASGNALLKSFNQEHWLRHYCPVCGGNADFAFLDKDRGARYLVCSRCDSEWLYKRIECPNCGNEDQNTLAYFTDNTGLYRLYVCEKCKDYLKAIDLRCSGSPVLIPFERYITLDLDIQARREGYTAQMNGKVYRKTAAGSR